MTTIDGLTPGTWTIDPTHTEVGFTVRHLMVSKVKGRFSEVSGTITVPEDALQSVVDATVQIASIDTRDANRDGHLKSADFFEADKYPTMTFRSTEIRQKGSDFEPGRRPHHQGDHQAGRLRPGVQRRVRQPAGRGRARRRLQRRDRDQPQGLRPRVERRARERRRPRRRQDQDHPRGRGRQGRLTLAPPPTARYPVRGCRAVARPGAPDGQWGWTTCSRLVQDVVGQARSAPCGRRGGRAPARPPAAAAAPATRCSRRARWPSRGPTPGCRARGGCTAAARGGSGRRAQRTAGPTRRGAARPAAAARRARRPARWVARAQGGRAGGDRAAGYSERATSVAQ
nr:YceI family protein [Angustibacter aerolatus]